MIIAIFIIKKFEQETITERKMIFKQNWRSGRDSNPRPPA